MSTFLRVVWLFVSLCVKFQFLNSPSLKYDVGRWSILSNRTRHPSESERALYLLYFINCLVNCCCLWLWRIPPVAGQTVGDELDTAFLAAVKKRLQHIVKVFWAEEVSTVKSSATTSVPESPLVHAFYVGRPQGPSLWQMGTFLGSNFRLSLISVWAFENKLDSICNGQRECET